MTAGTPDVSAGTASVLGSYFGIVSTIPSLSLTLWVYGLCLLQPWEGEPDLGALVALNPVKRPIDSLGIMAVAILLALVSHPMQFTAVQLLEGYWGPGRLATTLASSRMLSHLRRRQEASEKIAKAEERPPSWRSHFTPTSLAANPEQARKSLELEYTRQANLAVRGSYPVVAEDVLPTRLGNVLRRHESRGGKAVSLDLLTWATHIGMVADPAHTSYVQSQRTAMDLAVRMTWTSGFAMACTIFMMWPHGPWLLLALLPYTASWLSYRGAVRVADAYGQACEAWLHLNRFALYESLHLPVVATSQAEREQNERQRALAQGHGAYMQEYRKFSAENPTGSTETPSS